MGKEEVLDMLFPLETGTGDPVAFSWMGVAMKKAIGNMWIC